MIAIIAAMEKELNALLPKIAIANIEVVAEKTFYVGTFLGKNVVIAKSGIGKVNAAITAAILMQKYDIEYLINTGIAGGVLPSKSGDIVVSSAVAYSDVDLTKIDSTLAFGQMDGESLCVHPHPELLAFSQKILSEDHISHRVGTIVSGDCFLTSIQALQPIMAVVPNVIACEMEGMAIALTAKHFHVPFIIIRGISDVIDAPSQLLDYFEVSEKIAKKTTDFILRFLGAFSWKK